MNGKDLMIGILCFIAGALVLYGVVESKPQWFVHQQIVPPQPENPLQDFATDADNEIRRFDKQFNENFFQHNEPFEEMKRFRQNMGSDFDKWFGQKFGGGTVEDITKREDDSFVYFDIKVTDLKSTSIQTKVENGYIEIDGKTEKKSEDGSSNFESAFHRTFPVPINVDASKMETSSEGDKITLKFPKIKQQG